MLTLTYLDTRTTAEAGVPSCQEAAPPCEAQAPHDDARFDRVRANLTLLYGGVRQPSIPQVWSSRLAASGS